MKRRDILSTSGLLAFLALPGCSQPLGQNGNVTDGQNHNINNSSNKSNKDTIMKFGGSGNTTTDSFEVEDSFRIVIEIIFGGSSNFSAFLKSSNGSNHEQMIVKTSGPFSGQYYIDVEENVYQILIETAENSPNNEWEVNISKQRLLT